MSIELQVRAVSALPLVVVVAFLAACSKEPRLPEVLFLPRPEELRGAFVISLQEQIDALRTAAPVEDARRAYRQRDIRLVSVISVGLMVPGLPEEERFQERRALKIIAGTSDSIEDERQVTINELAEAYAFAYNREMLRLLGKAN